MLNLALLYSKNPDNYQGYDINTSKKLKLGFGNKMVKVYPRLQQGLGNQLFAAASAIKYANQWGGKIAWHECPLTVDKSVNDHSGLYIDKLIHIPREPCDGPIIRIDEPAHLEPIPAPPPPPNTVNVLLNGFFLQIIHLPPREELLKIIHWTAEDLAIITQKYAKLLAMPDTVAVHVRRGDYVTFFDNEVLRIQPYTDKAIAFLQKKLPNTTFVFFSDDLKWVQERYSTIPGALFVERDLDHYELYVMSQMKHRIMANSSYSLWAAVLGPGGVPSDSYTIAPYPWFGDRPKTRMYLDHWIKIDAEPQFNLSLGIGDVLMTAAAFRDHPKISLTINQYVVKAYRNNSTIYTSFLTQLVPLLFPGQQVDLINNKFLPSSKIDPPKTFTLPLDLIGVVDLDLPTEPFIVLTTRVRITNALMRRDIKERLPEIVDFLNKLDIPKVVIGERTIPGNYEEQYHEVFSLYQDLTFRPNDLDLTVETISVTPDLALFRRDCNIINRAKACIGIATGGALNMCLAFGQRSIFLCDYRKHEMLVGASTLVETIDEFKRLITQLERQVPRGRDQHLTS